MMEVDDNTPQIIDNHSSNENTTKTTEVTETIDVTNYPVNKKKSRRSTVYDKNLCKDNKPLTDFINKCILLDQTKGMETIINKVLLPVYVRSDSDYKQSERFKKVITKAFERLINDPDRKYTHISDIVQTLKFHYSSVPKSTPSVKKRVNFITLSTKVSVKTHECHRKRPLIDNTQISIKKSKIEVPEVIALDCDDDDIIPVDDDVNESINNQVDVDLKNGAAKDNLVNYDTIEIQDSQEIKISDDEQTDDKEHEHLNKPNDDETGIELDKEVNNEPTSNEHEKENLGSNENFSEENKLLVPMPHKAKIVRLEKAQLKKKEPEKQPKEMTEIEKAERIKKIEANIESYNKAIAKLDLEEVTDDSANSPYYKCDRLRATIVKLYKELCTLVGEEPTERRKIRLQIKEGVPQGPIKRLEKFLNKQADEEGETPFPDFSDVVRCVEKANENDGLGWSKAKVIKEAQAIFTYCGRALQKRRQQREWKHLRAIARPEEFEADPAERDLELQARLEANRQLARQREAEVFSKFTRMENVPDTSASTSFQIEPSEHEEESEVDTEPMQNPTETAVLKENNNNDSINHDNIVDTDDGVIKQEPEEVPINIQYQGNVSLVIEISDSESEDEYGVLRF